MLWCMAGQSLAACQLHVADCTVRLYKPVLETCWSKVGNIVCSAPILLCCSRDSTVVHSACDTAAVHNHHGCNY